jgi:hypothetical protein
MKIYELTPVGENGCGWKRWKCGGYGICGLDKVGATWFNPVVLGAQGVLFALSDSDL